MYRDSSCSPCPFFFFCVCGGLTDPSSRQPVTEEERFSESLKLRIMERLRCPGVSKSTACDLQSVFHGVLLWLTVGLSFMLGKPIRHLDKSILFIKGTIITSLLVSSSYIDQAHAAHHGVGYNFGIDLSSTPLPFAEVVGILQNSKANAVKIFRHNAEFLQAMSGVDVHVVAGTSNELIHTFAGDYEAAKGYINDNIVPFVPGIKIKIIVVGNEADFQATYDFMSKLPAAMRNVHKALQHFGLDSQIKVTHPFSYGIMGKSYPPSAGEFKEELKPMLRELLQFLDETGSPFMVNIYPFFTVRDNSEVPLDYALYQAKPEQHVADGQHIYTSLMDAMVDGALAAMEREGYPNLHLEIGEVGWPTSGHTLATVENARLFNTGLVKHILTKKGTPRRPGWMQMYIFALLDEDQKDTSSLGDSERHFGVYTMGGDPKYQLDLV